MEKKMKGWKKGLIAAGVVFLIAAIVLFVCGMTAADWDFKKLSTVHYTQKEYSLQEGEAVTELTVRYENARVEIVYSDTVSAAHVSYPVRTDNKGEEIAEISLTYENGALALSESVDGKYNIFNWNISSPAVTVTLPAGTECALNIETDSGDIVLTSGKAVSAPSAELKTDSGNIYAEPNGGLTVAERAQFACDTGNIRLKNISAGSLTAQTDTGNIRTDGAKIAETFSAKSDVGDIRLYGAVRAAACDIGTETGDIRIEEGCVLDAELLTLKTDVGDIRVNGALAGSRADYTFFITAEVGSSNVPSGGSGARQLTASTDTGDITLRFETE